MPRKTQKQKINKSTKRESLSFGDQELLKKFLIPLEQIVFNLSEENLESSVQQTMELFDSSYPYSFNLIISKLVYFSFCSKQEVNDVYLKYLKNIQTQEEKLKKNNSNIVKCFVDYISKIKSHEAYYFIEKMIDEDLIDEEVTKNIESKYFAHHQNDKVFYSPKRRYYWNHFHENTIDQSLKNARDVKKNDWELHKKLINEGMNENEISKIIRNDDIEKLQEIVSQNDFDFNQRIEPSLYEKNSYINENSVTLIDYAAFFGSVKCFKFLLLNNCNIESSGKYAIAGGNLEIIHLCEQNHSSFKDAYVTAIAFHRNDIFKYIYENEIEKINKPKSQNFPNHIYYRSYSPTFFGIYSSENHNFGDDQILKYLIYLCIVYSNYEILSFFEEKDNLKIDDFLFSICASTGNLYLFKYFLQINEVPKEILSGAFESENIELIKYVIDLEGIDINAKSDRWNGSPAIVNAAEKGYIDIVKMLLEKEEVNVNVRGGWEGETALMKASEKGNTEIVKLLLKQKDIEINAFNQRGETAFILASKNSHLDIVKLFMKQNEIDIGTPNNYGNTALILEARFGHTNIVKMLLKEKDIKINAKNKKGKTALMYAAKKGHTDIVKILLKQKKIKVNMQNKRYGETALILAAKNGHTEIVKLLLDQENIETTFINKKGQTALMLASKYGYKEIVDLLSEKSSKNST